MPKRRSYRIRLALQACALSVGLAQAAIAAPDPQIADLRTKLKTLDAALDTRDALHRPNPELLQEFGLSEVLRTDLMPALDASFDWQNKGNTMPEVEVLDMRLALAMLAQTYGAKDNFDVIQAQGGDMKALVIRKGVVTLPDLRQLMENNQMASEVSADGLTLQRPVIIWKGATLRVRPREVLQLSRTHGAFLMSFGRIEINQATIRTVGEQSPTSKDFIPFVAVTGGGSARVADSVFEDLGFGGEPKFSGFSIVRNPLMASDGDAHVENSVFDRVVSVSVAGARGTAILGNKFHDTRGGSLIVIQSPDARILGNIFSGEAPTNGIRLLSGSSRGLISGNLLLDGERAGIAVRNNADGVTITHNIVWSRNGGGISLSKANCGHISDNLVLDNKQKGIEIRTGLGNIVTQNKVYMNRSDGVFVTAQPDGAVTRVFDNRLVGNKAGLSTAHGEFVLMEGNDFSKQFPRFLDGELSGQARHIAGNMMGEERVYMTSFGPAEAPVETFTCPER